MQPVDLLGITIKTLAEIEKEVGSESGTKQKHHESCAHFVVRSLPLWKNSLLSFLSHCWWIKSMQSQTVSSELGMSSMILVKTLQVLNLMAKSAALCLTPDVCLT